MPVPKNLLAAPDCTPVWEPPGPFITREGREARSIHYTAFMSIKEPISEGIEVHWMLLVTPPEVWEPRTFAVSCEIFSNKTGLAEGYHSPRIKCESLEEAQAAAVRYASTGAFTRKQE